MDAELADVDSAALDAEIQILRVKYAKMRILFRVVQRQVWTGVTTRSVFWRYNKSNARAAYALMGQYKRMAGTFKRDHLNIFLVNSISAPDGDALAGTCTFPTAGREPQDGDGCIVDVGTLTGHKTRPNKFNAFTGHTLVHEVGESPRQDRGAEHGADTPLSPNRPLAQPAAPVPRRLSRHRRRARHAAVPDDVLGRSPDGLRAHLGRAGAQPHGIHICV